METANISQSIPETISHSYIDLLVNIRVKLMSQKLAAALVLFGELNSQIKSFIGLGIEGIDHGVLEVHMVDSQSGFSLDLMVECYAIICELMEIRDKVSRLSRVVHPRSAFVPLDIDGVFGEIVINLGSTLANDVVLCLASFENELDLFAVATDLVAIVAQGSASWVYAFDLTV